MRRVLAAVAAVTILSGISAVAMPGTLSRGMLREPLASAGGVFFAAVSGALLVVFGAALLHALLSRGDHPLVILWTSVEKLVAAGCWAVGLLQSTLAPAALGMIAFDPAAGALGLLYWRGLRYPQ